MSDNIENQENTPVEPTEVEQKALDMGWRPRDQFNGSDEEFVDAKEFVNRQPLFDKISQSTREVKELRKQVQALQTHYTAVHETAYKKALADLKVQRRQALSDGDGERFDQLDDEIKSVEKQVEQLQVEQAPQAPEIHPEFAAWVDANSWYEKVGYMRAFADDLGPRIKAANPDLSPKAVLLKVQEAVKKEFPHKFQNPNRAAAPNVEGSSNTGRKSSKPTFELTEQERTIMHTLERSGVSKEKYIADLKAIKGYKD